MPKVEKARDRDVCVGELASSHCEGKEQALRERVANHKRERINANVTILAILLHKS